MANTVIYTNNLNNATYIGSGALLTGLGGFSNIQTFNGSGTTPAPFTWVKPSTGSWIRVECIGAGGSNCGGGGGFTMALIPMTAVPGSSVAVVAGGGSLYPAGTAGNSTFGPYGPGGTITGYAGGTPSTFVTGGGGGGGGITAGGGGPSNGGIPDGGNGSSSAGGNGTVFGGGGGGKGAPGVGGSSVYGGGAGGLTTGGTSVFAGAGGGGGVAGVFPGGGGGPNSNGAAGQVRVIVF